MDKVISFVILAFNVEKYLTKCLDSFLCSAVMKQIEVIVVDDGSTDTTGQIADSYAERYPDVFVVLHKENGGHGSGINAGSKLARGKFLKAIDADDWVVTENLPNFVRALTECDAEAVLTPFHMIDMVTGEKTEKRMEAWKKPSVQIHEILENWPVFEDCCVFHGITYRTDFYRSNGYQLPEHTFYEDQEYNTVPFCRARSVAVMDMYIYQYQVGNDQQSVSFANQAKRISHLERVAWDLVDYYETEDALTDDARMYLLKKIESVCLIYLATAFIYKPEKKEGRFAGKRFALCLRKRLPEVYERIQKRYYIYRILNWIHMSPEWYQSMIQSGGYRNLKNTVKGVFQGR